jgi:Glycosyl transferase family 2
MIDMALQRLSLKGYSSARITRPLAGPATVPRVSVVVPCYNYGRFLPDCVDSVLAQRDVEVDVLIVDDASTDGSSDIADAVAETDRRVRVLHNEHNIGHIATYNRGFDEATGEYVILLSADDMLTPGALARAVALLSANPSVGFAYGWSVPFSGDTLPPVRTKTRSWSVWRGSDWIADRCRRGSNVIRSSDAVVRRSVLDTVGGYRSDLPHSGDLAWWLQAALVSDVGMVCGVDQMYYRLHDTNMSLTTYASVLTNLRETRRAFDTVLADGAASGTDLAALRETARRSLARRALKHAASEFMSADWSADAIEEYKRFAVDSDPGIGASKQWQALRRRESVGAERARRRPSFRAREIANDLEARLHWRRWRFSGI